MPPKKQGQRTPVQQKSPQPSTSGLRHSTPLTQQRHRLFQSPTSSSDERQSGSPRKVADKPASPQPSTSGLPHKKQAVDKSKDKQAQRDPSTSSDGEELIVPSQQLSGKKKSKAARLSTSKQAPQPEATEKKKKKRMEYQAVGNKKFAVHPATSAEVKKLQRTTHDLIPKLAFSRVVREILMNCGFNQDKRIQLEALQALQTAAEMFIIETFQDSQLLAFHAHRVTCMPRDMALVLELRKRR